MEIRGYSVVGGHGCITHGLTNLLEYISVEDVRLIQDYSSDIKRIFLEQNCISAAVRQEMLSLLLSRRSQFARAHRY